MNSPDGIPSIFYKKTIDSLAIPLLIIFKKCLVEMKYPTKWKLSYITPIFKAGDISKVENYRPISILPAISKIFDKLIYEHIRSRVEHLISLKQHGFTRGRSTATNLLEFVDYLTRNIIKGGQIDAIFMDLAKAFDRINHEILLKKLSRFPLDPCIINLLSSYLSDRTQIVCIGGEKSSPINPQSSVPQGSILSPLLFALFINDLPPLIKSNILLFADDVKIFLKINDLRDARQLQMDIETIINWCRINNLELNIRKCQVLSFTRRQEITFQYFNYNINNTTLLRVNTMKDLGVIFDSKLTFDAHINSLVKKSYITMGFIFRSLSKFRKISTYRQLYSTYIRSSLEYCTPVWNPHYQTQIDSLENIQRRFTRSLYRKFKYPSEKHYLMRYLRLEMLSLQERRTLNDEIALYKINMGLLNTNLVDSLTFNRPMRSTRFNTNNTFYVPFATTNIEYFSPLYRMQRQHDIVFRNVNLNEPCLNAFKRYINHEINAIRIIFDYSFE